MLLVAGVAILSYSLIYLPAWQRNQDALAELEKHRGELNQAQTGYAGAKAMNDTWQQLQQRLGSEFFGQRTVEERDTVVLSHFYRIQQLVHDSGVRLLELHQIPDATSRQSDDKTLSYVDHAVTMRVQGSYAAIADFLERLARAPRLARIDTADVTAQEGGSERVEAQIKGALTFYRTEGS